VREDTQRGTGRTTRMLEEAVRASTHSERVVIVVHAYHFIEYVIGRLADLCKLKDVSRAMSRAFIEHPLHSCTVHFMVNSDDLKYKLAGLSRSTPVFYDHTCFQR
jgi:hypothetical protein